MAKVNKKTVKKKSKGIFYKVLSFLLVIFTVTLISLLIYNELLSPILLVPTILVSTIVVFVFTKLINSHLRKWIKNIISLIIVVIIICELIFIVFGTKALKFISNITDTGYRVDTYGVYVLKESNIKKLVEIKNGKIGVLTLNDKNTNEAIESINKKTEVDYVVKGNIEDLLSSLINLECDAILFEESYEEMISDEFEELEEKIRKIESIDIIHKVKTLKTNKDVTQEPFMVYVSGIDTRGRISSKSRSDVNILVAVNPNTNQILMINTPRDYYVKLASKNKFDKLTHAGLYGIDESVNTLNLLYNVKVDYYARINFSSFVDIVNKLGGINVNVRYNICEQDSKSDKSHQICVTKGNKTLNGEQALAYARHRKTIGDRERGKNQMAVLEGLIKKVVSPKILTKFGSIIDSLQNKVITNMEFDDMKKLVNMQIKEQKSWKYNSISANGSDSSNKTYSTGNYKVYVMEPDENSINKIKKAIDNLYNGLTEIIS